MSNRGFSRAVKLYFFMLLGICLCIRASRRVCGKFDRTKWRKGEVWLIRCRAALRLSRSRVGELSSLCHRYLVTFHPFVEKLASHASRGYIICAISRSHNYNAQSQDSENAQRNLENSQIARNIYIYICGSPGKKSNNILLRILVALECLKSSSAELPLRAGLICTG